MKILVVEDEPSLNQIIAKRLKIEGYSVDQAENGRDALEFVALAEYDLLIVDILMPEMDGLTLVHTLREKNVTVPVLFLTALDGTEDKVKGLDAGGDDYLVKPFEFSELLARVRALLRRSGGTAVPKNELQLSDLVGECPYGYPRREANRVDPQRIFCARIPASEPRDCSVPG